MGVNMMLRTMKCLLVMMFVWTTVTNGSVMERGDRWVPMEDVHKIHARKADGHAHYGHNSAPIPQNTADPHSEEFCVDVSVYDPVVWVERDGEECRTDFVKQCEERSQEVCADVHETRCEVVPYKECRAEQVPQYFSETELSPKKFIEKACVTGKKSVPHKKLLPECRNVTKQNCVTNWETDQFGKQVWAGTDACEPVTWQECKLVPKDVQFIVPEITCSDHQELWYHEPEPKTETRMTNTFTCEVKSTSHCKAQTRPDCKQVTWNECREVPIQSCNYKKVHVPTQELLHRKKCLLPDEEPTKQEAESAPDGYGQPQADPLSSYDAPQASYSSS